MTDPISPPASPDQTLPVVRLRPKANARAIRHGFPWVFANEVVTDRRTKARAAGSIVLLEDDARHPLGIVAFNPVSKIMCRMLDRDPQALIDQAWFEARLAKALHARQRLFDAPYYRLIHAEADGLPGVVIDRFGDTCVIQPNAAWAETLLAPLTQALIAVTGVTCVLKNASGRTRALEGLDAENAVLAGAAPDAPVPVRMNGAVYMADLLGGQKTGLFLDQRPNHAFAASLAKGARVLDVFSHVGGFSLAALAGGAKHALAVDASAPALALATQGAQASGVAERFETRQGDAFEVLTALAEEAARFDLVICDPPAFAPAKPALDAGLRAYERIARLAAGLVAENGILGLCSCSHAADLAAFRAASARGIGRAGRQGALIFTGFAGPDHPQLPQLAESGYLKSIFFSSERMKILIDTCVLYPTVMREMVLGAAQLGAFTPLWSPRILEEWARAARKLGPDGELQARGEIALVEAAFPQASVRVPDGMSARLWLPDDDDIHVLAAAIAASADLIMTLNAKDFPRNILRDEGLERVDPDTYLRDLWVQDPQKMDAVATRVLAEAQRLSGRDWEMRPLLKKARLPRLAKALT